ncbi:class I SAM-dependent methyltransferase [Bacillus sp. 1P06AnD]|uniref:class I SAM-dependent methyltransferase n=1 Tax=Bacillus sp. 1P06AnD TaxID=3132208 RepID=UPI0039A0F44E
MSQQKRYWNASLYDEKHHFVSDLGKDVMEWLTPRHNEHILDVGCGTGDLTWAISRSCQSIIGIDYSAAMIEEAQHKYPSLPFQQCDASNLPFHDEFDAVFSNAALHWMKDKRQVIRKIYESLQPGGRFVAEMGGKGNVHIITSALKEAILLHGVEYDDRQFPWYFPSIGEYASLLEQEGFHVKQMLHFQRPTHLKGKDGLRNWVTMFADHLFPDSLPNHLKETILHEMEVKLEPLLFHDGKWIADYQRLRFIAIK